MTRFEFYGNLNKYHDTNSLEHKESCLKGTQRQNVKYYRREGAPGNYRYYWTKEEYDNAKNPKSKPDGAKEQAEREAQARNEYERKNNMNAFASAGNSMADKIQKISAGAEYYGELAKKDPEKAVEEYRTNNPKYIKMINTLKKAIENEAVYMIKGHNPGDADWPSPNLTMDGRVLVVNPEGKQAADEWKEVFYDIMAISKASGDYEKTKGMLDIAFKQDYKK